MPNTNQQKDEQKENTNIPSEIIDIQWQAPEFEKHEKGLAWFIILGIFALTIFTIVLLMKNFIFAILIVMMVFIVFIYALKEPRIITFKISAKGINIGDKNYSFSELKSFWIFYEPPEIKELSIKSKKWIMPLIKIPLDKQDPTFIRNALIKFMPEQMQEQSLIDILAKNLKF
ncbi:MAG: hypothetical protein A2Y98_00375 [Candidatus Portnoybacteria bacterium RBG_19FT_COMBO_36_7]|uniref:DUF5673 domain-containing protein n=1 Tax=Candidatus Portnoybacteria bacterium RBG_19FT_COMBO_36_7 TaxID=1801992 RepID=A0A1G2F8H3_9BACT|nr:MAG: hypothetical protein A2Y98_00375 [Candidatus Portnoybacteria bacterium RBG_19FT_COMBO_36_7]